VAVLDAELADTRARLDALEHHISYRAFRALADSKLGVRVRSSALVRRLR
jgi:hypothetical protein